MATIVRFTYSCHNFTLFDVHDETKGKLVST